jgi:MFS family permease
MTTIADATTPVARRRSFVPPGGALAGLSLVVLLASLGTSLPNVALPSLSAHFGVTFADVQWVVLTYLVAMTALVVGAGRLGDRIGRRRLMLAGVAVFGLGALGAAMAPDFATLLAARAAQGIGASAMMALSTALVGEAVPVERTGRAMGLMGTLSAVGTALGPTLGGMLLQAGGWRAVFAVTAVAATIAYVLVARFVTPDRKTSGEPDGRFDAGGLVLLALSLAGYTLLVTRGLAETGAWTVVFASVTAIAGLLFALSERRLAAPLVPLRTLTRTGLASALIANALVSAILMSTLVVGPFHLTVALGLGPFEAGLALSVGPVVAALMGVPAGTLVDRFGDRRMTVAGLVAITVGTLVTGAAPLRLGVAGYLLPIAVVTAGYALFQAANTTAVMRGAGPERGLVSGLLTLSRNLGLVNGASLMGTVFALATGSADVMRAGAQAVDQGKSWTFAASSILAAVALGLIVRRRIGSGRHRDEGAEDDGGRAR